MDGPYCTIMPQTGKKNTYLLYDNYYCSDICRFIKIKNDNLNK